jgi:hypothetical protein
MEQENNEILEDNSTALKKYMPWFHLMLSGELLSSD